MFTVGRSVANNSIINDYDVFFVCAINQLKQKEVGQYWSTISEIRSKHTDFSQSFIDIHNTRLNSRIKLSPSDVDIISEHILRKP